MQLLLIILLIAIIFYLLYVLFDVFYILRQLKTINSVETNREIQIGTRNPIIKKLALAINTLIVDKKISRKKARDTIKQLDMAINNISHDLRTPLTVANGYSQYITNNNLSEDERNVYLEKISSNLNKVEDRLELLLEYNRLNENRVVVNLEKVNFSRILEESLISMYESFVKKEFEMEVDIDSEIYVISDKSILERIVQNILGNMLAHGERNGKISLRKDKFINFEASNFVSEPIKNIDRLKERFYTEDFSRQNKNSGLGLYIVDELTALVNGKFEIEYKSNTFKTIIRLDKRDNIIIK